MFTNAKVTVTPVTLEPDVKSVLSKVRARRGRRRGRLRDRRAGRRATRSTGVEIPADVNASTTYPIAALTRSANAATAQAFVDYVLSPAGQGVLTAAGFRQP